MQVFADTTRRVYTGHEMLDNVLLVHMNGRVYEPRTGRFLSADPHVDGAPTTQGWNRYAYVHGRVLSARDPSGFAATSSGTVIVEATRLTPFDRDYVLPRLSELLRLRPPTTGLPLDGEGLERIEVRARRQAEAEDRQEPIAPVVVTVQGNLPPCSSIKGAWFDLESQIGAYGSLGTRLTLFGLPARGHAEVNLFSYNTPASGQAYWSRGVEGSIQIGRLRVGVAWEQRSFDGGFSFHSEPTNFMVGDLRGSIAGADYEVSMGAGVGFTASVDNLGALLPAADTPLCHP